MPSWLPDLPEPPDYARELIDAISRGESDIAVRGSTAEAALQEAELKLRNWVDAVARKLNIQRNLVRGLSAQYGQPAPSNQAVVDAPTTPVASAAATGPNGTGHAHNEVGENKPPGLSQQEKVDLNNRVEVALRANPDVDDGELVDTILAEYGPDHQWPVAQPRPTIGSIIYRARKRLGLLKVHGGPA